LSILALPSTIKTFERVFTISKTIIMMIPPVTKTKERYNVVLQGSVLDPLLYLNDLHEVIG